MTVMEGLRKGGSVWWTTVLMVVVGMLTCAVSQPPRRLTVGGRVGWTKDFNYTEWSIHKQFYVGDWLYFVFDKRYYNVLEVNKTNYEKCNDQNFITNITRGGRDVFELKQARPYYFLSSGGYCFHGMKLAINVEEYVLPPAAAPTINGGYMNNDSQIILTIVLGITLACALLMKLY
ncbi:unnamed protein product [Camellia sinensis]